MPFSAYPPFFLVCKIAPPPTSSFFNYCKASAPSLLLLLTYLLTYFLLHSILPSIIFILLLLPLISVFLPPFPPSPSSRPDMLRPQLLSPFPFILLSFSASLLFCIPTCSAGLASVRNVRRPDGLCSTFVLPYKEYSCLEYVAQTDDGFLLGIQRMWRNDRRDSSKRQSVLLFHGILTGGDVWVINPPGEGFGFILADAGYDVWISNYRSTSFSYGHISYTIKEKGFWDWSVDEIASQDLSASLQLVSSTTQQKVLLVAYSEGAQATLASFSRGELVDLVSRTALMAPVSYITNGPQIVSLASKAQLQKIYEALNIYQLSTRAPGGRELVDLVCKATSVKCYHDWFRVFSGFTCCINSTRRAFIDKYETQATSIKNLDHFSQQIRKKTFAMYDYGVEGNVIRYKQTTPPSYDMSKYPSDTMPTLFISGEKDSLANVVDVAHLLQELPPSPTLQHILVPNFGHLDFVFGYSANVLAYDVVLRFFQTY